MSEMPVIVSIVAQYKHDTVLKHTDINNVAQLLAALFIDGMRSCHVLVHGKVYFCRYDADNLCISKTLVHKPSRQLLNAFCKGQQLALVQ